MVYHGETRRNAHSREQEHLKALEKEHQDSVLHRHINTEHHETRDNKATIKMQVTSTHTQEYWIDN